MLLFISAPLFFHWSTYLSSCHYHTVLVTNFILSFILSFEIRNCKSSNFILFQNYFEGWDIVHWQNACLPCIRSLIQSPAQLFPNVLAFQVILKLQCILERIFLFLKIKTKTALHWWCMPIVPGLRRIRQQDHKFESQPGLYSKTCLKKQTTKSHWNFYRDCIKSVDHFG